MSPATFADEWCVLLYSGGFFNETGARPFYSKKNLGIAKLVTETVARREENRAYTYPASKLRVLAVAGRGLTLMDA
jgi:hypothetical protein